MHCLDGKSRRIGVKKSFGSLRDAPGERSENTVDGKREADVRVLLRSEIEGESVPVPGLAANYSKSRANQSPFLTDS